MRWRRLLVTAKALVLLLAIQIQQVHASSVAGTETLIGVVGGDFVILATDSSVSQSIALTASNMDKIATIVDPIFPKDNVPSSLRDDVSPFSQQAVVAAAAGDAADADRLVGFLSGHATIREYEVGVGRDVEYVPCGDEVRVPFSPAGLTVTGVAHLARRQIAQQLRSQSPYRVCLLVAGMSSESECDTFLNDETGFTARQVQGQIRFARKRRGAIETDASSEPRDLPTKQFGLKPRLFWLDEYGSLQRLQYGAHGYGSNFILSILDQGYRPDLSREEAVALVKECFAQLRMRYVINSPQPPCIKCIDEGGCRLM